MKYVFFTTTILCISLSLILLQVVGRSEANNLTKLKLKIVPSKTSFNIGEVVYFDVELNNDSNENLSFLNSFSEKAGYLNIFISQDGTNFKKYNHSKWGIDETFRGNFNLKPNQTTKDTLSVFWNKTPSTSNLIAADVIKRAAEGKILTDYAFPEAGSYFVKATFSVHLTNREKSILIESEPIQITIEEPVGENLEVWNKIKNNGEIAYFMQEGDFHTPSYKTEKREKLKQEIEQIIAQYPNSFYAEPLRQSLENFRASEAKSKEFMDKLKKQQKN